MNRKVAAYNEKGEVFAHEEEVPPLKENEVLIKVYNSLISPGTEMGAIKNLRHTPGGKTTLRRFGYANAGEIIDLKGEAPRGPDSKRSGRGIFAEPCEAKNAIPPCGKPQGFLAKKGECRELKKGMRVAAMGAGAALHANYCAVPVNLVVPIPENVSYEEASYACLAATALHGIRRAKPQLGEYGIILGLGIVGNLSAQLAQLSGARVIGWEAMSSRIDIARQCGIKEALNIANADIIEATKQFAFPYGVDFAVFAFGGNGTDAMKNVLQCMKLSADGHRMGRVVLVGGCEVTIAGGAATGNVDISSSARTGPGYHDPQYEHGRDYPNGFVQFTTQRNLREIIALISERKLKVGPMTTHRLALESAAQAADLLINTPDKALGIVFQMSH